VISQFPSRAIQNGEIILNAMKPVPIRAWSEEYARVSPSPVVVHRRDIAVVSKDIIEFFYRATGFNPIEYNQTSSSAVMGLTGSDGRLF